MEKKYFVYAFDIADKMITAALYCQDEKTAKWACRNAKDKMETDTDGFVFGVASLKKENKALENMNVGAFKDYATVAYPTGWYARENRYWMENTEIPIDDFEFADSVTRERLDAIIRSDNHSHSGIDVQFMFHAFATISKMNTPIKPVVSHDVKEYFISYYTYECRECDESFLCDGNRYCNKKVPVVQVRTCIGEISKEAGIHIKKQLCDKFSLRDNSNERVESIDEIPLNTYSEKFIHKTALHNATSGITGLCSLLYYRILEEAKYLAEIARNIEFDTPPVADCPCQIQAEHDVPIEPDTADSSPIFIAASIEKKKKKSALELYNEGKPLPEPDEFVLTEIDSDARQGIREDITAPIVETLEKTNAILERFHSKPIQIQFYPDDTPPDKIPDFDKDGYFMPQNEYAERTGKPSKTLSEYRESRHNPIRLPNGIMKIGNNKFGIHYCRQTGDKHNSPFEFFVEYEF